MRARLVENINFERGQDPKKSMNIGHDAVMDQRIMDLKNSSGIKFPFESSQPHWKDHRANVTYMMEEALKEDDLEMFKYLFEYQQKNYPDVSAEKLARILHQAANSGQIEYVIPLLKSGVHPMDDNDPDGQQAVFELIWFMLEKRLDNES